jgi:hypothetical protein
MVSLSADRRHRQPPGRFPPAWQVDRQARQALEAEIFGKRILFTGRNDWPPADVIAAYRSQADTEAGCRQLKDRHLVSFPTYLPLDRAEDPHACLLQHARLAVRLGA